MVTKNACLFAFRSLGSPKPLQGLAGVREYAEIHADIDGHVFEEPEAIYVVPDIDDRRFQTKPAPEGKQGLRGELIRVNSTQLPCHALYIQEEPGAFMFLTGVNTILGHGHQSFGCAGTRRFDVQVVRFFCDIERV